MKPHLSKTQLEMFAKCGEQYRRRYIEREIIPPGIALLKGTGFHGGAKVNMSQKIESHQDLPANEIAEIAASEFERAVAGGYVLTKEEEGRGSKNVIGEAKDETVSMAQFHAATQAPDYQPVMSEKTVRIPLPGTHDLLGIIDLADDQDRVTDFKTAGKRKSESEVDTSIQLTAYASAFKHETGREPSEVRLDVVVKTKTKVDRQVLSSTRAEADFDALAKRINVITLAISKGVFPPTDPGAWWCDERYCGYARTCPFYRKKKGESE